jgi:hypothetical protein
MPTTAPPPPTSTDSEFTSGIAERAYITAAALRSHVDPRAALAVASHEGVTLPGEVGDNGTSFGPWQLHAGGALPSTVWARGPRYAQQWANSPSGIDYAIAAIARVAGGETGYQAVHDIVYNFERPADPGSEVASSWGTYQSGGTPRLASGPGAGSSIISDITGAPGKAIDAVTGVVTKPLKGIEGYILRGLLILLGTGLVVVGLYFIVRSLGGPAAGVLDAGVKVATRGKVKASPYGRFPGRAAAERGEPVTVVSGPETPTRADRRAGRKIDRGRERAKRDERRALDAKYGDIPF